MKKNKAFKLIIAVLLAAIVTLIQSNNYQYAQMQKTIENKDIQMSKIKESQLQTIKLYILDELEMNKDEIKIFDMNGDGKVTSLDYVELKNKLEHEDKNEDVWISLGEFKITHYGIDCDGCIGTTASGTIPAINRTIAVDPTIIPLGSEVMINNQIYIAEDTGGAIKGNIIDLFVESEAVSYELGIYYTNVYVKEKE